MQSDEMHTCVRIIAKNESLPSALMELKIHTSFSTCIWRSSLGSAVSAIVLRLLGRLRWKWLCLFLEVVWVARVVLTSSLTPKLLVIHWVMACVYVLEPFPHSCRMVTNGISPNGDEPRRHNSCNDVRDSCTLVSTSAVIERTRLRSGRSTHTEDQLLNIGDKRQESFVSLCCTIEVLFWFADSSYRRQERSTEQ